MTIDRPNPETVPRGRILAIQDADERGDYLGPAKGTGGRDLYYRVTLTGIPFRRLAEWLAGPHGVRIRVGRLYTIARLWVPMQDD